MHSSNLLIQYAVRDAHRIGNEFLCDIYDLNIMLYYKNGQCVASWIVLDHRTPINLYNSPCQLR